QRLECRGGLVVAEIAAAEMDVLEVEEVAFEEFRVEIPVGDAPLAGERPRILELARPDGVAIGLPGPFRKSRERKRWLAAGAVEAAHPIGPVVPARVEKQVAVTVWRQVAVRIVGEDVARMVENDVEHDADAVVVCDAHHVAQVLAAAEVRIDIEEVLDA